MYFLHTRVIEIATKHLAFRKIKPFDNEDDVRFWTDSEKKCVMETIFIGLLYCSWWGPSPVLP